MKQLTIVSEFDETAVYTNQFIKDGDVLYVSFAAFSPSGSGKPFNPGLFGKNGLACVFVCQKWNHWWHTEDMKNIKQLIKELANGRKVVLYGSSMGGYATIHYSDYFEADLSISIAPQVLITPRFIEDVRWTSFRDKIAALNFDERSNLARLRGSIIVLSDHDFPLDEMHRAVVEECNTCQNISFIHVPYSMHNTASAVVKSGVINEFIGSLVLGQNLSVQRLKMDALTTYRDVNKLHLNFLRNHIIDLVKVTKEKQLLSLIESLSGEKSLDFEEAFMIAEIYKKLNKYKLATVYSNLSLSLYPHENIPQYLFLKHKEVVGE